MSYTVIPEEGVGSSGWYQIRGEWCYYDSVPGQSFWDWLIDHLFPGLRQTIETVMVLVVVGVVIFIPILMRSASK